MRFSRFPLIAATVLMLAACSLTEKEESSLSKYTGKYEASGFVVQVAADHDSLFLIVPGAPPQQLLPVEVDKFKSADYDDSYFLFSKEQGRVTGMTSEGPGAPMEFRKTSDTPDPLNAGDSLLTLNKSTDHFLYHYSSVDTTSADQIAHVLEGSYHRILNDFKLSQIPVTTVRIYPSMESFHNGINFPDAPPNILATAFGKHDIRMVSPHAVNVEDSLTLVNNIAHEFMHCVHLNIDYAPNNPRWLWEGIAMYESNWFLDPNDINVIKNKEFPAFATLNNGLEYELGYVIIEAIKDLWGFEAVIRLIKQRGDTQVVLKLSEDQFERKVYEHIYNKYVNK